MNPQKFNRKIFPDHRGALSEIYNSNTLWDLNIKTRFIQANHIFGNKGVLRGLHYQTPPYGQEKLVTVLKGSILDVAVNMEDGTHVKELMTPGDMFYIPGHYAHGVLTLEDDTHVVYFCSQLYSAKDCKGIIWNDSKLDIDWGIDDPILSENDKNWGPYEP